MPTNKEMVRFTLLFWIALILARPCLPDDATGSDRGKVDLNALTLDELLQVQVVSAALHPQTLQDAPASVSVITAEDIRKYGYRTLGEALAAVRGFYVTNDRNYETMGVRGFSLPGDYSSHLMVMVNGHNMADNVFDYMLYFGNDFPIDMNLVMEDSTRFGPAATLIVAADTTVDPALLSRYGFNLVLQLDGAVLPQENYGIYRRSSTSTVSESVRQPGW